VTGPVIQLEQVTKSYGDGAAKTQVLRGVSLDVPRGELLALVGQSGSGKSTLLNIVGGLDKANGGTIKVLGHDYGATKETELARLRNTKIGFVFQAFNLLDHRTGLGNVTLPAMFSPAGTRGADKRGRDALGRVGLGDFAARRPSELSGGQKQRVAIARALFGNPELLLCDEPTGNLDSATGHEVIEFFRELNQKDGVTLIIVTHERRVSTIAQRVISMRDGLIVEGEAPSGTNTADDTGGPA
jgi:putative ABC transport system ATP-binding protein